MQDAPIGITKNLLVISCPLTSLVRTTNPSGSVNVQSIERTVLVVEVRLICNSNFQSCWELKLLLALGSIDASTPMVDPCITCNLSINLVGSIWGSTSKLFIGPRVAL